MDMVETLKLAQNRVASTRLIRDAELQKMLGLLLVTKGIDTKPRDVQLVYINHRMMHEHDDAYEPPVIADDWYDRVADALVGEAASRELWEYLSNFPPYFPRTFGRALSVARVLGADVFLTILPPEKSSTGYPGLQLTFSLGEDEDEQWVSKVSIYRESTREMLEDTFFTLFEITMKRYLQRNRKES
jgi:hypothetical protein